jgi:hypothetical protein
VEVVSPGTLNSECIASLDVQLQHPQRIVAQPHLLWLFAHTDGVLQVQIELCRLGTWMPAWVDL